MFNIKVFVLVAMAICLVQSCSVEEPELVKSECSACGRPEGSCGCVKNCGCGGRPRRSPCSCGGCSKE